MKDSRRKLIIGSAFLVTLVALGCGEAAMQRRAEASDPMIEAPRFEVDSLWPKPVPADDNRAP